MIVRSICHVETRGESRATKGYKMIREEKRLQRCEGNERRERR